jgi:eukaryotic-like serine/threonine-protein kinase
MSKYLLILSIGILVYGCSKNLPSNTKSPNKAITSFVFESQNNLTFLSQNYTGVINTDTIKISVPYGTTINSLTPTIVISGVSVSPSSSSAQNFSGPVKYTVTAEDSSTQIYWVVVLTNPLNAPSVATAYFVSQTFFGTNYINAISTQTGGLIWRYTTTKTITTCFGYWNNTLYFGDNSGNFNAMNASNGTLMWSYKLSLGNPKSSFPLIKDGIIYFGDDKKYFYALNALTGNLKWQYLTNSPIDNSPTIANGMIYFGCQDGSFYALDSAIGDLKWKYTSGTQTTFATLSSPCINGNNIYFGDNIMGNLTCLNAITGSVNWKFKTSFPGASISSPTAFNNTIYFGSDEGYLYAIDANLGVLKWKFSITPQVRASPIISNSTLYVGAGGPNTQLFYALDANSGTTKWTFSASPDAFSSAVISSNIVYVINGTTLYFLDINSGSQIRNYILPAVTPAEFMTNTTAFGPVVVDANNNVFYPTVSGAVN